MTMTPETLRTLLARKEGPTLEFKLEYVLVGPGSDRNRAEVAKDLLALANSTGQGTGGAAYLILGAGDELRADGRREAKESKGLYSRRAFLDILNAKCTPPVQDLEYDEVELDGITYGVLTIPPSNAVRHLTQDLVAPKGIWRRNSVLVRHGDQVGIASPTEIAGLESHRTRSHVELLEASLDRLESPYYQCREGDVLVIKREFGIRGCRYEFPTIDFKFQNTGTAAAFLRQFRVEVLSAEIDPKPELYFDATFEGRVVSLRVNNNGWGPATNLELEFSEPTLNRLFGTRLRQSVPVIDEEHGITLSLSDVPSAELQAIQSTYKPLVAPRNYRYGPDVVRVAPSSRMRQLPSLVPLRTERSKIVPQNNSQAREFRGVELNPINVSWSALDQRGIRFTGEAVIWLRPTALTDDGFLQAEWTHSIPDACGSFSSDRTYVTCIRLDPDQQSVFDYPISRKIAPGDIDRFHVMVGATKSCILRVRFAIVVDKDTVIRSDAFDFHLWNPKRFELHERYTDGAAMARREEEIQEILRTGNYPGDHEHLRRELVTLAEAKAEYPFKGPFAPRKLATDQPRIH
jgi:hypothetical protein